MHLKMRSRMCDRYALFGPKESIRKIEDEPRHRYRLFKSFCKTDLYWKENHKPTTTRCIFVTNLVNRLMDRSSPYEVKM